LIFARLAQHRDDDDDAGQLFVAAAAAATSLPSAADAIAH
jgi:hypothetical protein